MILIFGDFVVLPFSAFLPASALEMILNVVLGVIKKKSETAGESRVREEAQLVMI
jgi:hypothetical protein